MPSCTLNLTDLTHNLFLTYPSLLSHVRPTAAVSNITTLWSLISKDLWIYVSYFSAEPMLLSQQISIPEDNPSNISAWICLLMITNFMVIYLLWATFRTLFYGYKQADRNFYRKDKKHIWVFSSCFKIYRVIRNLYISQRDCSSLGGLLSKPLAFSSLYSEYYFSPASLIKIEVSIRCKLSCFSL